MTSDNPSLYTRVELIFLGVLCVFLGLPMSLGVLCVFLGLPMSLGVLCVFFFVYSQLDIVMLSTLRWVPDI